MGWEPSALGGREFLILSHPRRHPRARRHAHRARLSHRPLGSRPADGGGGRRIQAAGRHPVRRRPAPIRATAARRARRRCSTACAYRNDAATVFRRLIRSLPTRSGVLGVATCDKGLPAMMMALAGDARPAVRARPRRRHAAADRRRGCRAQCRRIGVRFVHGEITLEEAAEISAAAPARRRAAAASSSAPPRPRRSSAKRSGMSLGALGAGALGTSDLARHGAPLGGRADALEDARHHACADILTDAALHNAMVTHAAFGGSTNLILHLPAIAHAAGSAPADRRGLDRRQPASAAPRRRAAERAAAPSDRAGVPGRRRARGDAASAPRRAARHGRA